ncbi:MAG: flagella basal body P-ring formation protein FlgA [Candidatus Sericytochromatia bacterium]|nr:flagella basal body P-ring formation protein FlgA [Candidatus Sericytochromatia bacterium]
MRVPALITAPLLGLAVWLLAGLPVLAEDLLWPSNVDAATFAQGVREEIGRAYKVSADAVTLEGLPAHGPLGLQSAGVAGDALRLRDQALRSASGRSSLPIDILEGGKLKRIVSLPVRVTVWSNVVVTRGQIPRGTLLVPEQLVVERRAVQTVQRGALTSLASALGQTTAMDLAPKTVLAGYLLKVATAIPVSVGGATRGEGVRVGTEVTVRVQSGELSLVGKGRVLDSGDIGKEVRVRLLNFPSSKVVKARVFSAQEVRVVMEDPS